MLTKWSALALFSVTPLWNAHLDARIETHFKYAYGPDQDDWRKNLHNCQPLIKLLYTILKKVDNFHYFITNNLLMLIK